jgi:hypothetical protein
MIDQKDVVLGVVYLTSHGEQEAVYRRANGDMVYRSLLTGRHTMPIDIQIMEVVKDLRVKKEKNYRTRDGRLARIIATDVRNERPVIAAVQRNDEEVIRSYYANGRTYVMNEDDEDLIEVQPYTKGQPVEVQNNVGWRQWYTYLSQLEEGIHLVLMETNSSTIPKEDRYFAVAEKDLRPKQD